MIVAPTRKPAARAALESPHQREHERSVAAQWRAPERLRDFLREFREACEAEHPGRLHGAGVESEQGVTVNAIASAIVSGGPMPAAPVSGGSHLGGPRWTADFRAYLDAGGSAFATYVDDHGEEQWAYPLRSALRRMDNSRSRIDQLAAAYCYLLRRCNGHHREAWAAQLGMLADPALVDWADSTATEALRRWWSYYTSRPLGRRLA